jgi:hypothetical protein
VTGPSVARRLFDKRREVFDRLSDARRAHRFTFRASHHGGRSKDEHRRRQNHRKPSHETLLLSVDIRPMIPLSQLRLRPVGRIKNFAPLAMGQAKTHTALSSR